MESKQYYYYLDFIQNLLIFTSVADKYWLDWISQIRDNFQVLCHYEQSQDCEDNQQPQQYFLKEKFKF